MNADEKLNLVQENTEMAPQAATPSVKTKGRRVGLSLRVLMVAVLLLGGGFGWLAYRARVQREAVAAIEAAGGRVGHDWDYANGQPIFPGAKRPWPKWLIDLVGPDYLGNVTVVSMFNNGTSGKADDRLMARIGRLDRLETMMLIGDHAVTEAGLAHLRGLTDLRTLQFGGVGITGRALERLKGMPRLEILLLDSKDTVDEDLAPLASFPSLKRVNLFSPLITDAGLAHLASAVGLVVLSAKYWFSRTLDDGPS